MNGIFLTTGIVVALVLGASVAATSFLAFGGCTSARVRRTLVITELLLMIPSSADLFLDATGIAVQTALHHICPDLCCSLLLSASGLAAALALKEAARARIPDEADYVTSQKLLSCGFLALFLAYLTAIIFTTI